MNDIYLIWSNQHQNWRSRNKGSTARVENASHYSRDEAIRICFHAIHACRMPGAPLSDIPVREEDAAEMIANFRAHYPGVDPEPYEYEDYPKGGFMEG